MPSANELPWERYRAILLVQARILMFRLHSRLHRRFDSSDLVQEALYRATKGLPNYQGGPTEGAQLGWLRKILCNYAIERVIKETGKGNDPKLEQFIGDALDDSLHRLGDLAAEHSSPSQRAERNEEIARLCAALQLLPEKERTVIILHRLEGLTIKATAAQLKLESPQAAAGVYARGMIRLRKLLIGTT